MRKILFMLMGIFVFHQTVLATDCVSAELIPAAPAMPYTQAIVCGTTNDISSFNATACGNVNYMGGFESLYEWTPTSDYAGVSIFYTGEFWSGIYVFAGCPTSGGTCVANITSSDSFKTLNISTLLTAGVTYYIMFDTWPSPDDACPGSFTLNGTPLATPPAISQDPGIPNCVTGSNINVIGAPATGTEWYWQTTASGTSTAELYTGAYPIFGNGTFYLRARHTASGIWSTNSSSIVVTNFFAPPAPSAPVAAVNPACISDGGTTITVSAAPAGEQYYWQGTSALSTSTSDNAAAPFPVTATGTYYVKSFDVATSCWSTASGLLVTVGTVIPDPSTPTETNVYDCTGTGSAILLNASPATASEVLTLATNHLHVPGSTANFTGTLNLPVGSTVTSAVLTFNNVTTGGGAFPSDFLVSMSGVSSLSTTILAPVNMSVTNAGPYSLNPVVSGSGVVNLSLDDNWGFGSNLIFGSITLTVNFILPSSTVEWFDAASVGTPIGSGSPLNAVGTTVLPNTGTSGDYEFFAGTFYGGCYSATANLVTLSLAPVTVELVASDVTCNNGNDGTFNIGSIVCGNAPFTYSLDGGATFGAAPTDLTVGDYQVIVKDAFDLLSGTYNITIGDAPAPSGLVINSFTSDLVDFSWTVNGSETEWFVEWGPAGFTPGTGTELGSANVGSPTHIVSGLDGNTEYDFYVAANCGAGTTVGDWVSISLTTLCDPILGQGFCESFDSGSSTEACWTVLNTNGDFDSWNMNYGFGTYSGDQVAAIITDGNGGANNDWLISPKLTLTNNEILSFFYRVNSSFEPNNFEVLLSTTGTDPADFTEVLMANASYSNTVYTDSVIDLSAYSGDCHIAFHVPTGGLDGWVLYIDQFCVDICIPAAGTDGTTDACRVDNTLDLNTVITQGETNGVWEFLPNQGVISGSDLNLDLLPNGTYQVEYIVTTACTTDTTLAMVTVHPASSAGNDGTLADNCANWSSINLTDGLTGSIDLGGTWTNVSGEGDLEGSLWTPSETTLAGSYDFQYVVSNGFCPNDTSVVTVELISCLGIDGNETVRMSVYPNPVTDVLTIQNVSIETGVIEVLDVQGKVVSAVQVNGVYGNYALDMNNVQRGMYIVRITTETSVQEVRVVKH